MTELPTATEIAADVRAGRRSAVDVVDTALDLVAERNGALNAFVEIRPSAARAAARAVDEAVARGRDPGPLAGVPFAVKDVLWEAGVPATAGSRALLDFRPAETAIPVRRLLDAGAIAVGRTNMPEFCYRGHCANDLYGVTSNPWALDRTPGGSSGGSAAAVAAGMVPVALGTDGGGSIRIPASFCGVVGMKPSFGLVPREPGWPGWYSLNHVGPLTSSATDAALVLRVLMGRDASDPASVPSAPLDVVTGTLDGLRIAYSDDLGYVPVDDEVRTAFHTAVDALAAKGVRLTRADPGLPNPLDVWNTLTFADNVASEGELVASGRVGSDASALIAAGAGISGADYARARNAQHAYAAAWEAFLCDVDLLLTPAMECVAFPHGSRTPPTIAGRPVAGLGDDWCHFCYPVNLTGQPAVSLPIPSDGLPVGLQAIGRRYDDATVLRFATWWERTFPWPRPPRVPRRPVDARVRALLATGGDEVRLPPDVSLHAGEVVDALRVTRAHRPDDTALVATVAPLG